MNTFLNLINNKIFKLTFLFSFVFVILSFFAYKFDFINVIGFSILCILFFIVSIKDLKSGLLIIFSELFLSSKGYFFFVDFPGIPKISLRIAIFSIFFLIYFSKIIIDIFNNKQKYFSYFKENLKISNFIKSEKSDKISSLNNFLNLKYLKIIGSPFFLYIVTLFLFIFFAVVIGIINGNSLSNIYSDSNAFVYFLIIFPFFDLFRRKDDFIEIFYSFLATSVLTFLFSISLLWVFAHMDYHFLTPIYRWVKDFGVGEVTKMGLSNFYRIFFQNHVYITSLFVGSVAVLLFSLFIKNRFLLYFKKNLINLLFIFISSVVFVLCLSRSFWFAAIITLLFSFLLIFIFSLYRGNNLSFTYFLSKENILKSIKLNSKIFLKVSGFVAFVLLFSYLFINFSINFPKPYNGINVGDALSNRFDSPANDEAGSSRINMLKPLFDKIGQNFFVGAGFGTTVKYKSVDPTNLKKTNGGLYETFAFEWGYLDLFLKFGMLGFIGYMFLLFVALFQAIKLLITRYFDDNDNNYILFALISIFVYLLAINMTTPYLNHPLGIGIIIIFIGFVEFLGNRNLQK